MTKKYLVTPALNYANGALHLGHLLEQIEANIFVRALRLDGREVLYICGADSHGTPIEINAEKAGVHPAAFAAHWQKDHSESLKSFGIEFDGGYGSTHTKENEEHVHKIFNALKDKGFIKTKEIEQLYDPKLERFLPDRMVHGTCPKCHAKDQYGDSCESCGRTYLTTELIDPKSAISGAIPIVKKSIHYFVSLETFEKALKEWTSRPGILHEDTKAFLGNWFKEGLKDWDISRDGPYFGFLIPNETNKYFYVWLDAPIGYISLSEKAAILRGQNFADYWLDKETEIIHFIGKDIVYFHTLFWPAMLMAAEYNLPKQIMVHGMLTVDGVKMSKSRGTFILADTFKKHINSEALRYYYACKLSKRPEDIDLNLNDFIQRVNTDLVNKLVNLISRTLPLLHRYFDGLPSPLDTEATPLIERAKTIATAVRKYYLDNEPSRAIHEIVRLSEEANRYLQESAPWSLVKTDPEKAHKMLSTGLYIGKVCFGLLKPVLPHAVGNLEKMLNQGKEYSFATVDDDFPAGIKFEPFSYLFERIDEANINAMVEESKNLHRDKKEAVKTMQETATIDIQKFMEIDLRAAKVISATTVEGSDKLIQCKLDLGPLGERQVFSGLRPHIQPQDLVGKIVVVVANLEPRKMRFGMSEGMILACGEEKPTPLFLNGVALGERVR